MNLPTIEVTFKSYSATQEEIRKVIVDTFKKALDAAGNDVTALRELQSVAKEFRWMIDDQLGVALYGPAKTNKETLS